MNKKIAFLFVLTILISSFTIAQTNRDELAEQLKERVLNAFVKGIEAIQQRLTNLDSKIQSNTQLSDESKTALSENIAIIQQGLTDFKTQAQVATTIEEIREIKQQTIQFLKDNGETLQANLKIAAIEIGEKTKEKAEEFQVRVDQTIRILKVTCPSQAATIADIEEHLEELETEIAKLTEAISAQDVAKIKEITRTINDLSKDILETAKEVQQACIPSSA